jgi:tRNA G10  N-methylase Trm11
MVFTDPPYGVSYTGGHNKKQRKRIIADELQGQDLSSLFEDSINTACIFSKDSAPFYFGMQEVNQKKPIWDCQKHQ